MNASFEYTCYKFANPRRSSVGLSDDFALIHKLRVTRLPHASRREGAVRPCLDDIHQ